VLREKELRDRLAAHRGFFEILEAGPIQRDMAVGVISQIKSGVEPHVQGFNSLVHFAELVELVFIHETNYGDLLLPQRGQQL